MKTKWRKLFLPVLALSMVAMPVRAEDEVEKHDLEHMRVTINATAYKNSQFIERETIKGKEYIMGKSSSYNKQGESNAGTLLQPNAEYVIRSKMAGGTYHVTVFYALDKDKLPEQPKISIGINTQKAQQIEIKDKLVNSVKATFKVNFLKGKQHTVKLWFPSEGVKVREIRIAKALLPQKKS